MRSMWWGGSVGDICPGRLSIGDMSGLGYRECGRCVSLVRHQQRYRRFMHEAVGHPAQQPLAQAKMAVSAHDDQIGLSSIGLCHQFGSDLAGAALDAMKAGVNAMMPEMIDGVDAHHRLFLGRSFAGRDPPRNLLSLLPNPHPL